MIVERISKQIGIKNMQSKQLSRKALKYGELQVRKMIKDRPAMGEYISENDFVWKWAVRKFAGEDLLDSIDWNKKSPYYNSGCDHVYPSKLERGYIRVKKDSGLSFDRLWAMVIFELHNIASYKLFHKLIKATYKGQLNKRNFIIKMAEVEFKAVRKTEQFYKNVWEPWSNQKGLSTNPSDWYVGVPRNFKDWIKYFDKSSDYPWKIYSAFYDNHLEEWALVS